MKGHVIVQRINVCWNRRTIGDICSKQLREHKTITILSVRNVIGTLCMIRKALQACKFSFFPASWKFLKLGEILGKNVTIISRAMMRTQMSGHNCIQSHPINMDPISCMGDPHTVDGTHLCLDIWFPIIFVISHYMLYKALKWK